MKYGKTVFYAGILCVLAFASPRVRASEADALAISANIQAKHLPFGTILDPIFASSDSSQIVGYTRCGDSAIWTGHYLAAEAFRYEITRSADALDNIKRAIAGIKALNDVTGTNLLARCMVPVDSPYLAGIEAEEAHNGIYTNSSAGWVWVGQTTRDQYAGVLFGLGVAYDMVDDPGVKASASDLITRNIDFLKGHAWTVVMPDGAISTTFLASPHEELAFLQIGRHVNPGHFNLDYDMARILGAAGVPAAIGVDVLSDNSYSKFNLDYISFYNLIRLEGSIANSIYLSGYNILRRHTDDHQNAFFDVIDRALNGPDTVRDSRALAMLDQWLQRPRRDQIVDLHNVVPVCGDQACDPVPVPLRPPTDFLWQRNPFQLEGGGVGTIEGAGIDYILPYWMARYYAVASAFVQSAAARSSGVAPGSIASLYGANLSSQTLQASTQPLPTSLGGVTLTVQDSTGVSRQAALVYVSSKQINFIVPADAALGPASFSVSNGVSTIMATATIQSVAPTLFTLTGDGTGLVAATAIRTIAGNVQLQSKVPVYQCDSSGCVSTPVELGVDTPIYLTLYGTGVRNRSSLSSVIVTINGIQIPAQYAGPQADFAGLDQVNLGLPLTLRGAGLVNLSITVDGQTSNTALIDVR